MNLNYELGGNFSKFEYCDTVIYTKFKSFSKMWCFCFQKSQNYGYNNNHCRCGMANAQSCELSSKSHLCVHKLTFA